MTLKNDQISTLFTLQEGNNVTIPAYNATLFPKSTKTNGSTIKVTIFFCLV